MRTGTDHACVKQIELGRIKMKRYQLWLTTLVMVCILCACGGGAETSQEGQETSEPSPQETISMQELSGKVR